VLLIEKGEAPKPPQLSLPEILLPTATQHLGLQKCSSWPEEKSHPLGKHMKTQAREDAALGRPSHVGAKFPSTGSSSLFPLGAKFNLAWGTSEEAHQ
jgi:hypothetical protein